MKPFRKTFSCILLFPLFLIAPNPTLAQEGIDHTDPITGMEFVFIKGGSFQMGDLSGIGTIKEKPVHKVETPGYYIGKHEVTFAQYDQFCEASNTEKPDDSGWGRDNRPAINVSWREAVNFTRWLSQQTGQNYRLPSESEWEYAARAGTTTNYWWGETVGKGNLNCRDCGGEHQKQTSPVGSYAANPWGLFDTAGNVYEWTFDNQIRHYEGAPKDGAPWVEGKSSHKIMRGGSWNSFANEVRSAFRDANNIDRKNDTMGFRVVMEPQQAPKLPQ